MRKTIALKNNSLDSYADSLTSKLVKTSASVERFKNKQNKARLCEQNTLRSLYAYPNIRAEVARVRERQPGPEFS